MSDDKQPAFTMEQLERLWELFEKSVVYKCLVNGKWIYRTDFDDAKALSPLRIEVKKAKECLKFPAFIKAKM